MSARTGFLLALTFVGVLTVSCRGATAGAADTSAPANPEQATPQVAESSDQRVLRIAKECAEREFRGLGVHGAPLDYAAAQVMPGPGDAASASRIVAIPEKPPMNDRVPSGRNLLIGVEDGSCKGLAMR